VDERDPGLTALVEAKGWPAAFRASLATRADSLEALQRLALDDLFFAHACADGEPAALSRFESELMPVARAAIAKLCSQRPFVDELCQSVRTHLLLDKPKGRSRLLDYAGRGPLAGWVRVVAARLALTALRRQAGEAPDDEVKPLVELATGTPELAMVRAEHQADVIAAMTAAFAQLELQDRNMIRMRSVDGRTMQEIADVYGINVATVSRRLLKAEKLLFRQTRRELSNRLRLSAAETESLLNALRSQLNVSLQTFLGPPA
jgi:RNA polymerase sigma-70 factor (ECF subfamily)